MTDQELRLECLKLANGDGHRLPHHVVEGAGSFYNFATNKKDSTAPVVNVHMPKPNHEQSIKKAVKAKAKVLKASLRPNARSL